MANSKLTREQKEYRKEFISRLKKCAGVVVQYGNVTCVLLRTGECMGDFSVAIASPDEQKIRRKVGEYMALYRWVQGAYQPVPLKEKGHDPFTYETDQDYLRHTAENIAFALGNLG